MHATPARRLLAFRTSLFALAVSVSFAATAAQLSFSTPNQAIDTLVQAARAGDEPRLLQILGPGGKEVILSGDKVADRQARAAFLSEYDQSHELLREKNTVIMLVGNDAWPFPVALVLKQGQWRFGTRKGAELVVRRRIERNELAAVSAARAYVHAQRAYAATAGAPTHEYARKLISSPGLKDGLYWPTSPGEPESPMGPLIANALRMGYRPRAQGASPSPYFGYYYRILEAQGPAGPGGAKNYVVGDRMTGGFALVAFPAEYGVSGNLSFIVGPDGVVYEKDLGADTARTARGMTQFNPDSSWTKVSGKPPAEG